MDAVAELSDSRLANLTARSIFDGFDAYQRRFRIITRRARVRFEQRDWIGMQTDSVERLKAYGEAVGKINEHPAAYMETLYTKTRFPEPAKGKYQMPPFSPVAFFSASVLTMRRPRRFQP